MNKVSLNGVEIYPFDSEQSLLSFVNDNKGILVAINAEKILHATDQTRIFKTFLFESHLCAGSIAIPYVPIDNSSCLICSM